MVEGAEFIIWEGAEWVELRLEEEGLACNEEVVMVNKHKLQHLHQQTASPDESSEAQLVKYKSLSEKEK